MSVKQAKELIKKGNYQAAEAILSQSSDDSESAALLKKLQSRNAASGSKANTTDGLLLEMIQLQRQQLKVTKDINRAIGIWFLLNLLGGILLLFSSG